MEPDKKKVSFKKGSIVLRFVQFFKCLASEKGHSGQGGRIQPVTSIAHPPSSGELYEFLNRLLRQSLLKKPDVSRKSACKIYQIPDTDEGDGDKGLLNDLQNPVDGDFFSGFCTLLAERYGGLPRSRSGFLIFINWIFRLDSQDLPFFSAIKCDFEDMDQFTPENQSMELIKEALSRELKKTLLYPYFDGFERYHDRFKVFQKSNSDYFDRLIGGIPPKDYETVYRESLENCLKEFFPQKTVEKDLSQIPEKRELFGESSPFPPGEGLKSDEVGQLSILAQRETLQNVTKRQKIQVIGGEDVRFTAPLEAYGRNFWLAQGQSGKFLIVRGENFETRGAVNPLDFLELPDILEQLKVLEAEKKERPEEDDEQEA